MTTIYQHRDVGERKAAGTDSHQNLVQVGGTQTKYINMAQLREHPNHSTSDLLPCGVPQLSAKKIDFYIDWPPKLCPQWSFLHTGFD